MLLLGDVHQLAEALLLCILKFEIIVDIQPRKINRSDEIFFFPAFGRAVLNNAKNVQGMSLVAVLGVYLSL